MLKVRGRKLSRRHRRILITCFVSVIMIASSAAVIFQRRLPARYNPNQRVEGITAELERNLPIDHPNLKFVETSKESGVVFQHFFKERSSQLPEDMGSGAAWGDYDNDGDNDLLIVNICGPLTLSQAEVKRSPASCKLFKNNGDGSFVDATKDSKLQLLACGMGAAWGDYNGDGWLDVLITSYPNLFLFKNNKDSTFTDVSKDSGLSEFSGFWTGASWADYDKDGDLDFYVCGYVKYNFAPSDNERISLQYEAEIPYTLNPSSYQPESNLLFNNNGNGGFSEVAQQSGVDNPAGRSLSAAWCDFDMDGWDDLYVANDVSDNAMFKNLGNGKFADVSHASYVADYRGAMGLGVGDWDNDGDFDIFITHWIAQENALFDNMLADLTKTFKSEDSGVKKAANQRKMSFMDVADQFGLGQVALDFIGWGTSFFDFNNDGRQDLLVVNGSTFQDEKERRKLIPMRHLLFWNRDSESGFFEVGPVSGDIFRRQTVGRGAAFADYDNDGDVDLVVVNHSGRAWLLRNDGGNKNRWLTIRVRGDKNRFGVSAKVKIATGHKIQTQQIGSQPSYLSQNALEAHFGVGAAKQIDQLIVAFPSGKVVKREKVGTNQTIEVKETE